MCVTYPDLSRGCVCVSERDNSVIAIAPAAYPIVCTHLRQTEQPAQVRGQGCSDLLHQEASSWDPAGFNVLSATAVTTQPGRWLPD